MGNENEREISHIDLDDEERVKEEIGRVFGMFPHLAETAVSDGLKCPSCGSVHVEAIRQGSLTNRLMKSFHCRECKAGYTRYEVDQEHGEWGQTWHENVVSFHIEGYPYYLYFAPGTHNCKGIGLDVFPWK